MKLSPTLTTLTLLAALSLPATPALAVYTQEASTFSAGGGVTTSASYENLGVIGQPGIVGSSSSTGYTANHGFLSVLGDGFKILYPVIAATPGSFTFALVSGTTSAGQSLGISNTGGSTLNWTVAKNAADSIFSITPATGTDAGTVTISADATALTPGSYSNTLTVSGAGIEQTMLVQLDLTVSAAPTLYTLAVTLKLATPGKGGGTVTSTIPDGRLSCQRTGGVSDVICSADFPVGTITLAQTPDSNTQWATWGAPGCGSNPTCQVVLNAPQGTDVTFPYASMAKVNLGTGYESLAQAYGGAAASDVIKARAVTFPLEDLLLNSNKTITLLGGLDAYYAAQAGQYSTLNGKLTIATGALVVDKLVIK